MRSYKCFLTALASVVFLISCSQADLGYDEVSPVPDPVPTELGGITACASCLQGEDDGSCS